MTHDELFEKHFTGTLSAEETSRLKRLLAEDEEAQRDFVRFTRERSILVQIASRRAEQATAERPRPRRALPRPGAWIFVVAAAALFAAVAALFLGRPPAPSAPVRREEVRRPDPEAAARAAAEQAAAERAARERMARVEEESRRAQERLAALERERRVKADDEARRAEEELARLEARRRDEQAAIEKAAAERRRLEEELARKPKEEPPTHAPKSTVASAGLLELAVGEVFVLADGARTPARAGVAVLSGQALETSGEASSAAFVYADGTRLELAGDSAVQDVRDGDLKAGKSFSVGKGIVTATVAKQPADRPLVVTTPHGQVRVLGTTLRVVVAPDPAAGTRVEVREGKVRVVRKSDGRGADVASGQYAIAAAGPPPVARPLFTPRLQEAFNALPAWASAFEAPWAPPGSKGSWTLGPGQGGGSALVATRTTPGSSVQALVFNVPARTRIEVSAAMKCPAFPDGYWAEFGFRLGSHKAEDFDVNPAAWTLVKKLDNYGGQNGNGNAWTVYAAQADTGSAVQVTVAFKLGTRAAAAPTAAWDALRISW